MGAHAGVALLKYVKGRNTEDIDLIVAVESLRELPEIAVESENESFGQGTFGGLRVNLFFTRNRLFDKVRKEYTCRAVFAEADIPCATVEGLTLLKLYALPSLYRQGNFARVNLNESDIAALLEAFHPAMEPLYAELSRHLSVSDLDAVKQIVDEIQVRLARFRKGLPGGCHLTFGLRRPFHRREPHAALAVTAISLSSAGDLHRPVACRLWAARHTVCATATGSERTYRNHPRY